jgi:hypothetical protein
MAALCLCPEERLVARADDANRYVTDHHTLECANDLFRLFLRNVVEVRIVGCFSLDCASLNCHFRTSYLPAMRIW